MHVVMSMICQVDMRHLKFQSQQIHHLTRYEDYSNSIETDQKSTRDFPSSHTHCCASSHRPESVHPVTSVCASQVRVVIQLTTRRQEEAAVESMVQKMMCFMCVIFCAAVEALVALSLVVALSL